MTVTNRYTGTVHLLNIGPAEVCNK